MTLREAIEKFKERCENDPKIQEMKQKILAQVKAKQEDETQNDN